MREEEKMSGNRQQRKRERGRRGGHRLCMVEVAPGVSVGSLRRFRAALIGPTQEYILEAASAAPI